MLRRAFHQSCQSKCRGFQFHRCHRHHHHHHHHLNPIGYDKSSWSFVSRSFVTFERIIRETSSTSYGPAKEFSSGRSNDETEQQSQIPEADSETKGLFQLLTASQRDLLKQQRSLTARAQKLSQNLSAVQIGGDVSPLYDRNITHFLSRIANENNDNEKKHQSNLFDSTFTVVIAGEFNAGKSTIINALMGNNLLETGALPTTDSITILTSKEKSSSNAGDDDHDTTTNQTYHDNITTYSVPNVDLLQDLTLIDTPGTNAVVANHTTRTTQLLPIADLIIFVTSADRPFPESERMLLKSIQAYRKNIVVVINKMDILEASGGNHGEFEKQKVLDFVTENARDLLGANPVVLPLSARDALHVKRLSKQNKRISNKTLWERSKFATLEQFLYENLTAETKIKAKLLNPVGVIEGTVKQSQLKLKERQMDLDVDIITLNMLTSQMKTWMKEMEQDLTKYQESALDVFRNEQEKCRIVLNSIGYIEQTSMLLINDDTKFQDLWNESFSNFTNANHELASIVEECSDSLATKSRSQGQAVIDYLGKRPAVVRQNLIGSLSAATRFEETRKDLSAGMSKPIDNILSKCDPEKELETMLQALRSVTWISGGCFISSFIAGTLPFVDLLDPIYGSAAASFLGIFGIAIVPIKKEFIIRDNESLWGSRIAITEHALKNTCSKQLQRVEKRILDGVSPYTRYVETEQHRLREVQEECEDLLAACHTLRSRINKSQKWN